MSATDDRIEPLAKLERRDHVAVLTLNRAEKLNALNDALAEQAHSLLDEVEAQWPDIRVLVLTGAGRAFCAGGDAGQISERVDGPPAATAGREIVDLAVRLRRVSQPVIAAINGPAIGAGLALACASDIRIAAASAKFSCPFVRFCLTADTGISQSLQQIVGRGVAAEMLLTGAAYDAAWAERVRLVNCVTADEGLLAKAFELAEAIATQAPAAVRANKRLLDAYAPDLSGVVMLEREFNRQSAGSLDRKEAALSFSQKRPPRFEGR